MKVTQRLDVGIILFVGFGVFAPTLARAVQLRDGTIQFLQPPGLVEARVTDISPGVPASYYFTIGLPEAAGEPLQRVTLTQQQGNEYLAFSLKRTRAKIETGQELSLGDVTSDREQKIVSIAFNPPVPSGHTVKIRLRSVKNPQFGGVYLFKVTAYPPGEKVRDQFLGFGRFQFTSPGGRP